MIALSTASVYPESTADGFELAARLGYDAVEVMVGIDSLSQQTSAVKQLSDHHDLPVCAVHAPCLLFTQRVWGSDPWGKLERSAEMAEAVGAARRLVREALASWDEDSLVADAALIMSELATNAIVHGGSAFRASIERAADVVLERGVDHRLLLRGVPDVVLERRVRHRLLRRGVGDGNARPVAAAPPRVR